MKAIRDFAIFIAMCLSFLILGCSASTDVYERAIQDYDEVIRLDPQDAATYNNRGNAYGKLGQHRRSIEDYDEAIRLDPQLAAAYYNRGTAYSQLDQAEGAIQSFDQAIRLNPEDAEAYRNRGRS